MSAPYSTASSSQDLRFISEGESEVTMTTPELKLQHPTSTALSKLTLNEGVTLVPDIDLQIQSGLKIAGGLPKIQMEPSFNIANDLVGNGVTVFNGSGNIEINTSQARSDVVRFQDDEAGGETMRITKKPDSSTSGMVGINNNSPNEALDVSGNIQVSGNISASGTISGSIDVSGIPTLDINSKTDGVLASDRLSTLDINSKTSGVLANDRLPTLDINSKTSGVLANDRLPTLDINSKTSGVLANDRLPPNPSFSTLVVESSLANGAGVLQLKDGEGNFWQFSAPRGDSDDKLLLHYYNGSSYVFAMSINTSGNINIPNRLESLTMPLLSTVPSVPAGTIGQMLYMNEDQYYDAGDPVPYPKGLYVKTDLGWQRVQLDAVHTP